MSSNVLGKVLIVLLFLRKDGYSIEISDKEIERLPNVYQIDDYDKCRQERKQFCKISLQLFPKDVQNPSEIWRIIEKTIVSNKYYSHDELQYAICADNYLPVSVYNRTNIYQDLSKNFSQKFDNLGLEAHVSFVNCRNYDNFFTLGVFDILWMSTVGLYLIFVSIATIYDVRSKNRKQLRLKYLPIFSVRHNIATFLKNNQKFYSHNLRCIQGFRFYTTVLIIFCHTYGSFIGGYISNTSYLENIPENIFRHGLRNLFVFLVQTFFLISAWLLSFQTLQTFYHSKNIKIRNFVAVTFLSRYLRILPPVLFMVTACSTIWMYTNFRGPIHDIISVGEYNRCRKNWWINLLFINNHFRQYDMCYFITWYLAADTQLYLLSLIGLVIFWKLRIHIHVLFSLGLLVGISIPAAITYIYDLDIIYRINPKNAKYNMFFSSDFSAVYSGTYCHVATYVLGLLFGYFYFKYGQKQILDNKIRRTCWGLLFLGLPLSSLVISSYRFSGVPAALISALLKPLYALGVGIGIFGMSLQEEGFLKRIFEWKPAVFLGSITYSTYMVQMGIVFYRTAVAKEPLFVSDFILISAFLRDTFYSFFCGFLMHILLELPALQLQNMLLPKIRRHKS